MMKRPCFVWIQVVRIEVDRILYCMIDQTTTEKKDTRSDQLSCLINTSLIRTERTIPNSGNRSGQFDPTRKRLREASRLEQNDPEGEGEGYRRCRQVPPYGCRRHLKWSLLLPFPNKDWSRFRRQGGCKGRLWMINESSRPGHVIQHYGRSRRFVAR
jgi:hypothetical protein